MTALHIIFNKYSRNKLLFASTDIANINFIDIGLLLSRFIESNISRRNLPLLVDDELNAIISSSEQDVPDIGKCVAIKNIGILFEPDLNIQLGNKLDQWSRDRIFIVNLEGSIVNDIFHLGKGSNPAYSCSLKNITYKTIYDNL